MVSGISINVAENIDQNRFVRELKFSPEEQQAINQQINELVKKRAAVPCRQDNIQFISNIFVTPKKTGDYRTILNLKKFSDYVDKIKFKMETLESIFQLVTPFCLLTAIDLVDAYLMVYVHLDHHCYLKFYHNGVLLQYICLPFRLTSNPHISLN